MLVHGQTYHFQARSRDGVSTGPYSRECFLTVDAVWPGVPRIESTDFPDGEPVILARTTGTVTLRPAIGDSDVQEYLFGSEAEKITGRIKAGPDGTAVLPRTVFEDPVPSASLFVQAVDRAGNVSLRTLGWDLQTFDNPAPRAHERGDVTGDGRADVTTVLDHGFGRTMVWNVTARDGGFYAGTAVFDPGFNGGVPANGIRHVRGDFDGDGRTDVAIFRQKSDGGAQLWQLRSDGNRYGATTVWDSGSEALPLSEMRALAGDFDADGKTDIAVQQAVDGGGWRVLVFRGGALGVPAAWFETGPAGGDWSRATLVAGDADGDGFADLIEMRDQGRCRTTNWVYRSSGTAFTGGVLRWDSGPGGYCANRSTPVVGDVDGDGRDDIVASYRHRGTDTAMVVFTSASGFTPAQWWRRVGEFDAGQAVLSTGDFDLDGKDDLAVIYPGSVAGQTQLWTLRSTGTAFADRVLGWQELTGGVPARFGQ